MDVGGPHPEVGEDLSNDFGLFNEGDDPHWSGTPGTTERIRLIDLFDQPCPRALCGRGGDLGELDSSGIQTEFLAFDTTKNGKVYEVFAQITAGDWNTYEALFKDVIASFSFTY